MAVRSIVRRSGRCIGPLSPFVQRLSRDCFSSVRAKGGPSTGSGRSREFFRRLLPIPSVELLDSECDRLIEAVGVHAPGIRMRSRLIEALHPAVAAEQMLRRTRAEA